MGIPAEANYSPWVDEMYTAPQHEREELIQELLHKFSKLSGEGKKIVESLEDKKEFEKPILLAYMHFTAKGSQAKGTLSHLKFPQVALAMKHKKLPLIFVVSGEIPNAKSVEIEEMKGSMGIPQVLTFTETLSRMGSSDKDKMFDLIIEGIRSYRPAKSKDDKWLSDYLISNSDWKFLGFSANLPYLNVDPSTGDTKNFWIHAWGTPQLLFSHRRLPAMMIAGPSVRLDENVMGERNMTGFTG